MQEEEFVDTPPPPEPFPNEEASWPAFDEHSLFESAAVEVATHVEVIPEMARTTALAAMAMACQGVIDVEFPNGHTIPASLNLLTIAKSGERKTALENWFFEPIRRFEREKKTERDQKLGIYERKLKNWQNDEKALTKVRNQAFLKGDPLEEIEERQIALDQEKPTPPRNYRLIYEDATPSALAYSLYENIPLACLLSSEAGSVFQGKVLQDFYMLNTIWSGSPLNVSRRSSPSFILEDPRLSIALMAQPEVINRFLEKRGKEARDNGFLSRFMIINPTSLIGTRTGDGPHVNPETINKFHQQIEKLLNEAFDILESDQKRRVVGFTATAKTRWKELNAAIERDMQEHGLYYHAAEHGSKLMDNISRVAAIIHTFEGCQGDISSKTLDFAYSLGRRYSQQYLKYLAGEPEIVTLTNQLVRDIRRHITPLGELNHSSYYFNKSEISQKCQYALRPQDKLLAALGLLEQLGHLEYLPRLNKNIHFKETLLLSSNSLIKNGVHYTVDELPLYENQQLDTGDMGRYVEYKIKSPQEQYYSSLRPVDPAGPINTSGPIGTRPYEVVPPNHSFSAKKK
ncbi:DUF3987 domain-containing protein (plasmid) [Halomonas sediminis]